MTLVGFGALAFFGSAALLLLAAQDLILERLRVYRTLRSVRAIELSAEEIGRRHLAAPLPSRVVLPALRRLGVAARRFTPASVVERLNRQLGYAGQPARWDAERVLAVKVALAGALGAGTFLLGLAAGLNPFRTIILTAVVALVAYLIPDLILHSRASERQETIRRALPDSLDLLSITVEAGLGFDAAVARVARETGGPLGQEFHRVLQEMQLGMSRADAFRGLAERSTVPELKSFVLSMVQADIFGISVAKVLQIQAKEMRIKRRQHAEERAQKVPVKILFPLLFCIFPALFIVLLGPAALRIYESLFLSH
ncbi:MAG: type II secretion system F family protein [Actinomycetota bacterium]